MRRGIQLFVTVVLILTAVLFFQQVFSYDTDVAHPILTEKIIALYNSQNSDKISSSDKNLVVVGSREEDTPIRWMNHFYNPITNEGLWGFETAKDWNRDGSAQGRYVQGDQSWDTAIDAYAKGDKAKAFEALGHVLHLIEDMAVPAHTRLDTHIEGDPYEQWVKNNHPDFSVSQEENYGQIDYYFYQLAAFSNSNFFSKDTVDQNLLNSEELFWKDIGNGQSIKCVKGEVAGRSFCLARYKKDKIGDVSYDVIDATVNSDYYSLLAPKAVSYGAGVIELFFDEGEKRKAELAKEQSELWQRIKNLFIIQDPGAAGQSAPTVQPPYISPDSSRPSTPVGSQTAIAGQPQSAVKKTPASPKPATQPPSFADSIYPPEINYPTENPLPLTKNFIPAPTSSFFFGSGKVYGGSKTESPLAEEPAEEITPEPPAPTTTGPLPDIEPPPAPLLGNLFLEIFFATSTETEIFGVCSADTFALAAYWATDASSTPILSTAAFTITTSTSNSSTWRATTALSPGQNFWYFSASDESNNTSTLSAAARFVLDTTPPEIQSFIAAATPADTSTLIHLEWAATDTLSAVAGYDLDYDFESGDTNMLLENSSSTFFDFSATTTGQYNFYLRARDVVGNFSETSTAVSVVPISYSYNYLDGQQTENEVVLTATGSPYILKQYSVPAGKILRIEPGAVIKGLIHRSWIKIYGAMIAAGAADNHVIFTSVQDQSFGDDWLNTTALGNGEPPEADDWNGLWFQNNASGAIQFADFRYSGRDPSPLCLAASAGCGYFSQTIYLDSSSLVVENTTFASGGLMTFFSEDSSLTISTSTLDGSPKPVSEDSPTMGVYIKRGSLNLRAVNFQNFYYGASAPSASRNWPAITAPDISSANFVNVTYPFNPAGMFPLPN